MNVAEVALWANDDGEVMGWPVIVSFDPRGVNSVF